MSVLLAALFANLPSLYGLNSLVTDVINFQGHGSQLKMISTNLNLIQNQDKRRGDRAPNKHFF